VRKKLLCVALVAVASAGLAGTASAKSPCKYKGKTNGLPVPGGLPAWVYANGDMSPSGYVGVGDGTSDNYAQVSGDAGGVQVEGKSKDAGQSGYANTGASYGSC